LVSVQVAGRLVSVQVAGRLVSVQVAGRLGGRSCDSGQLTQAKLPKLFVALATRFLGRGGVLE
jgi:hypothetical protein